MKFKLMVLFMLFVFINTNAQTVSSINLKSLKERTKLGKDTTYVINLWATWCAPCVEELPYFEDLQKKHINEPVKIILLSIDFVSQLNSKVIPLVKKLNLQTEVFIADKQNEQEFIENISKEWEGAIPATIFANAKNNLWQFFPKEFTPIELEKTYQSLK